MTKTASRGYARREVPRAAACVGGQPQTSAASATRSALAILAVIALARCADPRAIYLGADLPDVPATDASPAPVDSAAPDLQPARGDGGSGEEVDAAPSPPVCLPMRADCDGDARNGCEVDLGNDPAHCGSCNVACNDPDCVCREGRTRTQCPPGRADCDADPRNGCEVDSDRDTEHCGGCGRRCPVTGHDAVGAMCTAGRCQVICQRELTPEGDCDGNPDNGCETSLQTNENCGACGVRCLCSNGVCL